MAKKQSNIIKLHRRKEVLAVCNHCNSDEWKIVLDKPVPNKILAVRCARCKVEVNLRVLNEKEEK